MDETKVISTRQALYDLVWSIPMWTLAKHMGYSDTGIAKICKRNNIPRPPRGYWRKIETEKKAKKPLLPNSETDGRLDYTYKFNTEVKEDDSEKFVKDNTPDSIVVKDTLSGAHPLVSQSSKLLEIYHKEAARHFSPFPDKCLDIRVTKPNIRRALFILDSLIKALEDKGHEVFVKDGLTQVRIHDVDLQFNINEISDAIFIGAKDSLRSPSKHNHRYYKHVSTGKLCLTIVRSPYSWQYYGRKNWSDTKRYRLEDLLVSFTEGLIITSIRKKEYDLKIAEEKLRREEQERLEIERQRKIEEEKTKRLDLMQRSDQWHEYKLIREYLSEVERQIKNGNKIAGFDDEWLQWACQYVDQLDPFSPLIKDEMGHKKKTE